MRDQWSTQVLCAEHERLLKESQVALTNWIKGRAEIHKSGHQGKGTHNELRALQATYSKAWALLQYHAQDCEVCQVISIIERVRSEAEADESATPACPKHETYMIQGIVDTKTDDSGKNTGLQMPQSGMLDSLRYRECVGKPLCPGTER